MYRFIAVAVFALLIGRQPSHAADINGDGVETILVPFAFFGAFGHAPEIPGAHGTIWSGEVWFDNRNEEIVDVWSTCRQCIGFVPRAASVVAGVRVPPLNGFLFDIALHHARNLTFSSRIFERTLRAQPRGVDIPVVREGEFFSDRQTFLGVPAGADVRTSLRIYDPWTKNRRAPAPPLEGVIVDVYSAELPLAFLGTATLQPSIPRTFDTPGFAAIYDLAATFPRILDELRVNIRVRPVPEGAQYWGIVAVTDNETQTVSIITAQ